MKPQIKLFALLTLGSTLIFSESAMATPIVIAGNNPQSDENVLLNSGAFGAVIQGTLNQSGGMVNFSSESGDLLSPSSGQARIEAGAGNDPFTSLTFWLSDGATFTSAIFNLVGDSGLVEISVSYLNDGGSPFISSFDTGNGSNFFTVLGGADTLLTQITLSTADGSFDDLRQVRIGGFAAQPAGVVVSDNGRSLVLLSLGLLAVAILRRHQLPQLLGVFRG
jgi:hypothetical protein